MRKQSFKPSLLRFMRLSKNLTVETIAKQTGIHEVTLRSMENGYLGCGELNARRLGDFFGIDWKKFKTKVCQEEM